MQKPFELLFSKCEFTAKSAQALGNFHVVDYNFGGSKVERAKDWVTVLGVKMDRRGRVKIVAAVAAFNDEDMEFV